MNRYLTTYTVIVHENYSVTVPPSTIDGDDVGDEHYPSFAQAMEDLFGSTIIDEMPCRIVLNFERHDCDPERTCDRCGRVES